MNVEFLVHGVPKGVDFMGSAEDKSYCETFYNNKDSVDQRFVIEAKVINNKRYYYYHYIKGNISDVDNRSGAYLGLTLRFDIYCKDPLSIYDILHTVYISFFAGNILERKKDILKYSIAGFREKESLIKQAYENALSLIPSIMQESSFIDISKIAQTKAELKRNWIDCTADSIQADIERNSIVSISLEYPTINTQRITNELQNTKSILNSTTEKLKRTETKLNDTADQKKNLETKVSELERKLNEDITPTDDSACIRSIYKIVKDLEQRGYNVNPVAQNSPRRSMKDIEDRHYHKGGFINSIIHSIIKRARLILLALLVLLALLLGAYFVKAYFFSSDNKDATDKPDTPIHKVDKKVNVSKAK